jgi:hypothetical protein
MSLSVGAADVDRLQSLMKDRNAPQSALDGTVIGRNMQRDRQEFIRFPNGWGTRSPRSSGTTAICAFLPSPWVLGNGGNRRNADIAGRGLGRVNWADTCPPKGRWRTAGLDVKPSFEMHWNRNRTKATRRRERTSGICTNLDGTNVNVDRSLCAAIFLGSSLISCGPH